MLKNTTNQPKSTVELQWRSSAPKSGGGGTNFFKWKAKNWKKKKKKKGHCGVKAQDRQDRAIVAYNLMHFLIKLLGYVHSVLKLYQKGGLGVLPQKIFTELGKN